LADGGNNGGIAGENCLIIDETFQTVDVKGVGNGFIENIRIGTVAGLITTTGAPIVGYFPQYALYGQGKTLHSSNQLRAFGNTVDDCPTNCGGKQMVVSHQGHCISLTIRDGLPYMQMTKPTQSDIDRFEHVVFTSDDPSDPSSMNSELFLDAIDDTQPDPYDEYPEQCYHYAQHTTDGELDAHTSERRTAAKGKRVCIPPFGLFPVSGGKLSRLHDEASLQVVLEY